MKGCLTIVLSVLLLSGCGRSWQIKPVNKADVTMAVTPPEVYLSRSVAWKLPHARVVEGSFAAVQSVKGRYGDRSFEMIFQLEKKADDLVIVAVTPMGQQLLQVEYRGGVLTSQVSPLLGGGIKPAYLISDFLLAFGQVDNLLPYLKLYSGLRLEDKPGKARSLYLNDDPLVTVAYSGTLGHWPKSVKYRHEALNYELDITLLSLEPL